MIVLHIIYELIGTTNARNTAGKRIVSGNQWGVSLRVAVRREKPKNEKKNTVQQITDA